MHLLKTTFAVGLLFAASALPNLAQDAAADPAAAPAATDISVTYIDKWMWDITMYMVELTIDFRDPKTNFPLATGNSLHTSLTRKSPDAMVDEVLNNILSAPKK